MKLQNLSSVSPDVCMSLDSNLKLQYASLKSSRIVTKFYRITIVFASYYDRIRVVLRSCLGPITIVNWILYDRKFHRNDRISVKKIDFVRLREESNALCLWMLA